MGSVLSSTPLNLVDLFFYFEGLEVIEFGFVRLKFGVEFVFACFFLRHCQSLLKFAWLGVAARCVITYRFIPLK